MMMLLPHSLSRLRQIWQHSDSRTTSICSARGSNGLGAMIADVSRAHTLRMSQLHRVCVQASLPIRDTAPSWGKELHRP